MARKSAKQAKPRLSDRQARFVDEYVKDQNATRAYLRAGYKTNEQAARRAASRLLTNVDIRSEIDDKLSALREKVQEETGVSLNRVITEIAKGAFFDPRKFFHADGSPKAITELDDDTAAALAGMDVVEEKLGRGEEASSNFVRKYKLAERKGYLDMLMKHLGGYEADNRQKTDPLAELMALVWGEGSRLPVNG